MTVPIHLPGRDTLHGRQGRDRDGIVDGVDRYRSAPVRRGERRRFPRTDWCDGKGWIEPNPFPRNRRRQPPRRQILATSPGSIRAMTTVSTPCSTSRACSPGPICAPSSARISPCLTACATMPPSASDTGTGPNFTALSLGAHRCDDFAGDGQCDFRGAHSPISSPIGAWLRASASSESPSPSGAPVALHASSGCPAPRYRSIRRRAPFQGRDRRIFGSCVKATKAVNRSSDRPSAPRPAIRQ